MPWTSGKIQRFCFASWGFVRKITERKNGPIQICRKNGFGVRFSGSAPLTSRPPDRQERLCRGPAERSNVFVLRVRPLFARKLRYAPSKWRIVYGTFEMLNFGSWRNGSGP